MADDVNQLLLQVDAQVELARRNLHSLEKEVGTFQRQTEKHLQRVDTNFDKVSATVGKFKGVLATLGVGVGLGALTGAARSAMNMASEITKASRIAGLSAEDFQSFAYAAKSVGFESDKVADILKDVNDKFGDFFQTGAGPLADFFEQIAPKVGVTAEQFRKLNSRDALQLYVESLEKANVSQADMTFYMEALANDATALIPILKNGGQQLSAMEQEFKDLGLSIDDNMIQRLTQAQKAWDRGLAIMKNRATIFAGGVIEVFERIGEAMDRNRANFILSNDNASESAQQWAQDTLIAQRRAGLDRLSALSRQFAPGDYLAEDDPWKPPTKDPKATKAKRGKSKPTFTPNDLRQGLDLPPVELPINLDADAALVDLDALRVDADGLKQTVAGLNGVFSETFDADLQRRLEDIDEAFKNDLSRTLGDVIVYGDDLGDSLESAFKRAASAMLEAIIQAQILGPLLENMGKSGGGGGLFGKLLSFGSSLLTGGSSLDTSFTASLGDRANDYTAQFRAAGGPVVAGRPYIVGEKGPELVVPRFSGSVVPNHKLAMGNGQTINVNVDARGATDPAMVRTVALQAVYEASGALINAAQAQTMRGLQRRRLPGGLG